MLLICPSNDEPESDETFDLENVIDVQDLLTADLKISIAGYEGLNDVAKFFMCSSVCPCLTPDTTVISEWTEFQDWFRIPES